MLATAGAVAATTPASVPTPSATPAPKSYPTGITPYIMQQAFTYFREGSESRAESLLRNNGYTKVGSYRQEAGYTMVFTRSCKVNVSRNGTVTSATATGGSQYASYILVGPGIGLDWDMSLTFLSTTGKNAFVGVLKKGGYIYRSSSQAWVQRSTGNYMFQSGNTFSIAETVGADDL